MLGKWLYKMLKEDLFIPLRVYAGGAHMNSLWKCGICSLAIIIVVGLAFKYDVGGGYMDIWTYVLDYYAVGLYSYDGEIRMEGDRLHSYI